MRHFSSALDSTTKCYVWLLLREDLGDGLVALLGMPPLMGDVLPPARTLRIEIVDIAKGAGGKEGIAQVANLALDFALGESRQMPLMAWLRIESFASPIPSIR